MNRQTTADQPERTPGLIARSVADPRFDRWRTTRGRRRISMLHVPLSLVFFAALAVTVSAQLPVWQLVVILVPVTMVWMWATGVLNGSINGMTELGDRDLDEVQRRVRDHAYRMSYRATVVVVGLLSAAILLGAFQHTTPAQDLMIAFAAFFTALVLPAHVLAWTLPDD